MAAFVRYIKGQGYELDDKLKLYLIYQIIRNYWPFLIDPYRGMESPFPRPNEDSGRYYRYTGPPTWKITFDDIEVMPDDLPEMSTAAALALAVLNGDKVAALALADKVMEENR